MERFREWKTVALGAYASGDAYTEVLARQACRFGSRTTDVLERVRPRHTDGRLTLVRLALVSGTDLGFDRPFLPDAFLARGRERGIGSCPLEAAPALRWQDARQPDNQWLPMLVDPVADAAGVLRIAVIGNHGGIRYLTTPTAFPASGFSPEYRWICQLLDT